MSKIGNTNTAASHAPIDEPAIGALLASIVPGTAAVRVSRIAEGVSTRVYRVERDDEHYYLRILPEEGKTFAPEVRAHELARAAGARVPDILYYEARNPQVQRSVMLTTEIPGQSLGPEVAREDGRRIVIEAGRDLARINSILVDGFGWVRRDMSDMPAQLTAEHNAHRDFMLHDLDVHLATLRVYTFNDREIANIRAIVKEYERLLNEPVATLAHGDFDMSHIFVHQRRYSGIIDFGEIRGTNRLYDLAHHRMHGRERLPYDTLPFLLEGYDDIIPLPVDHDIKISFLSLLIAIRAAGRGLQRSPDSPIVGIALDAIHREVLTLVDVQ